VNPAKLPSRLFYVWGVIRNRPQDKVFSYPSDAALDLLGDAREAGVLVEELEDVTKSLTV
jgi:hypothetical protein